jgi:hypothetical protein
MSGLRPEDVTALAQTHYGDDEAGYDTDGERMFALLVDVADAYVLNIRARMTDEYERADAQDREPVQSMGTAAGMGAVEIAVQGLLENLEMRDEERA